MCRYTVKPSIMKLESLHIKNYKLFRDLEIPRLGRVNLITGKNNTGKTILLEALRIWASEGDASVINNIIWKRGDWDESSMWETYSSLYFDRNIKAELTIGDSTKIKFKTEYVRGRKELREFSVQYFETPNTSKVPKVIWSGVPRKEYVASKESPNDSLVYVPASIDFDNNSLWKDIVFNRKREDVIKVLKVIDERITEIEIIENKAFVGLDNVRNLIPLKNFGEGLNRLLTIAMALVSAEDNLLLIDEIDTGLHHTVLEKLWEIIFEYAEKLDAQVFVTTHSNDCVSSFSYVYSKNEKNKELGNYFRLRRSREDESVIEPVYYGSDELEDALMSNIEIR